MKRTRGIAVAQPAPPTATNPLESRAHGRLNAFANRFGDQARRASSIVRKLTLLCLFSLPVVANAVGQAGPAASSFGITTAVTSTTGTATLPNFQLYPGSARLLVVTASNITST